jgi:hypothetical protein
MKNILYFLSKIKFHNKYKMSLLLHGDCLEQLKTVDDKSVDLIFCDLPYGQTSCKWDVIIPWEPFWKEIMRVKKLNTPIFFTTTTKFGVELINNAPKKCPFRYDLVWVKSAPAGFLSAKKMPMRKHEMVYAFYEKLPFYDLSSHTHKFIKKEEPVKEIQQGIYGDLPKTGKSKEAHSAQYDPPLPVSVMKEDYGVGGEQYDPPLPVSVVKEPEPEPEECKEGLAYKCSFGQKDNADNEYRKLGRKGGESAYDPPLPTSVLKEDEPEEGRMVVKNKNIYHNKEVIDYKDRKGGPMWEPPLPTSVVKEEIKDGAVNENYEGLYGGLNQPDYVSNNIERNKLRRQYKKEGGSESAYEPPT